MIRLDNISKQNGHQLLFIEASMGVAKGEKVEKNVMVPFQLVTKDNYKQFMGN